MKGEFRGPRLSRRRIGDLRRASDSLAAAAETIKRANPAWAAGAINAIITANDIVVDLYEAGSRSIERYEGRGPAQAPQHEISDPGLCDKPDPEGNAEPEGF